MDDDLRVDDDIRVAETLPARAFRDEGRGGA
jgi:hypothetical protein